MRFGRTEPDPDRWWKAVTATKTQRRFFLLLRVVATARPYGPLYGPTRADERCLLEILFLSRPAALLRHAGPLRLPTLVMRSTQTHRSRPTKTRGSKRHQRIRVSSPQTPFSELSYGKLIRVICKGSQINELIVSVDHSRVCHDAHHARKGELVGISHLETEKVR